MIRCSIVLVGCAVIVAAGTNRARTGDDKDPVKEKLFAAKVAYDAEMDRYRKAAEQWFDAREQAARKDGNKKLLDQLKVERAEFQSSGVLPKGVPVALQQKPVGAKKALQAAYNSAVKEYTKAKKDDEAAAVEREWEEFTRGSTIDLLALIDPKAHTESGQWKRDGAVLVGTGRDAPARIRIPYEPGEEYDVSVRFTRIKGDTGVAIGLVAGGRQVLAQLDGFPDRGYYTGLDFVDGKQVSDNVTSTKGQLLKADTDYTFLCSVRSQKIDLSLNGKLVTSFKGEFTRLSIWKDYVGANPKALFLFVGPNSAIKVDRVTVTSVKGKGTILK